MCELAAPSSCHVFEHRDKSEEVPPRPTKRGMT